MNNSNNQVQLTGRLGKDPIVKSVGDNKVVATFNMVTSDFYTNFKGEKIADSQWHRIVAWGKTAEMIEKNLKKGSEVSITGKLTTRTFDDKEGKKVYMTEVVASDVEWAL